MYYAGHGVISNTTHAVCNGGPSNEKTRYPLERALRSLGRVRGGYVVAIFDCCRERFKEDRRGGNEEGDDIDMDMEDYSNFIAWFGCPPESTVAAKSTIAIDFFEALKERANPSDGTILLP